MKPNDILCTSNTVEGQDIKTTAKWDRMGGRGGAEEGRDIERPMTDPCCMTESNTGL